MTLTPVTTPEVIKTAASATTLSFTAFTPTVGEYLVIKVIGESGSGTAPAVPSGGPTFTAVTPIENLNTQCFVGIYTATVASSSSITLVVTSPKTSGSTPAQHWSAVLERWPAGSVVGAIKATTTGTGAPSTTLTTTGTGSAVSWCNGDFAAKSAAGHTYNTTSATPVEDGLDDQSTAFYVAYFAYQQSAVAGSQTLGITAPGAQTWCIQGVEVVPGAAGGGGGQDGPQTVPMYLPTLSYDPLMQGVIYPMRPWQRRFQWQTQPWLNSDTVTQTAFTGAAATTVTATLTAAGVANATGDAATTVTASRTATGTVGVSTGAATTVTTTLTASGSVATSSGAATTVTATSTATGNVATFGDAATSVTANRTATGNVATFGAAATVVTATLTAAGTGNTSSGAATTVTATLTATGSVASGLVGNVATTVTATLTASGNVATSTGAATVVTATLTASGTVGKLGAAATTVTVTPTAAGNVATSTGAATTVTATLTATGSVVSGLAGNVATTVTATLTATGTVGRFGAAATTVTATLTATGNVATSSGAATVVTVTLTATGAAAGAIILTPTPADRILIVYLEQRTAAAAAEQRTVSVTADPRILAVPADSRTVTVNPESRMLTAQK